MKRSILTIFLALLSISAHATTWYVNSSTGGTRYSASNTSGQCNGKADTAYSGSGTNKPCPFNDARLLWNDPYAYQNAAWVMAAGDTVILETGGQISGSQDASAVGKFCFGLGTYCIPPDLPSGSSAAHTRLLGKNYASCSTTKTFIDASAPTLVGDPVKQTAVFAASPSGQVPLYALSVASSQYVDIECLDISSQGGRSGSGISSGNATNPTNANILIQDVTIHGFADSAWRGNIGGTWTLIRDTFQFNAQAGVNNDPGNNQQSNGSIVGSYVSIFGNGCSEEYPIAHAFPAINCKDQNNGGYGDGWGTAITANLNFSCDHCLAAYNTQDGIDGGHLVGGTLSVTNSQMYGNMGGNLKGGPNAVSTFTNDIINGNCMRMHDPINGSVPGFNSGLTLWCRAGGDQNSVAAMTNAVALDGQMQTSGKTVTGSGTHFLSQLAVGKTILPGYELLNAYTRVVTAIASDTSLTVSSAFPHDITGNEPIIVIPTGGATSTSVLTVQGSSFVGYGATMWDVPCQTGIPQAQVDPALCAGAKFVYKSNVNLAYAEATYNDGVSPGMFYNILPTDEDYNLFYNFRSSYGTGAHDVHTSPLFVSQPAKPLTAESQMDSFNFNLTTASPAKGTGLAIPGLGVDFNGFTRNIPPSMGAIEFGSVPASLPAPQMTLTINTNPATLLQPVTLSVTVTGLAGKTPTGTVIFTLAGIQVGTATLDSSGTATFTTSTLGVGLYLATASYSGDSAYTSVASNAVSLTVNAAGKTASQVTVGLSSSTISALQPVTFTAAVTAASGTQGGSVTPTGSITFYVAGNAIGTVNLNSAGSASISTSTLTAGTYAVTASYSGDSAYTSGTSTAASLSVSVAAKSTAQVTLGLSSGTITVSQPVTLTTSVATTGGATPTGAVTFYVAGSAIGTVNLNSIGSAAISTSTLGLGTYAITASYTGDSSYTSGISNVASLTVNAAGKTAAQVTLGLSSNSVSVSQPVTFSAQIATIGSVVPTGSVTFSAGGVTIGAGTLNGAGVTTFATSSLLAGSYSVIASYSGDSSYSAGVSNSASLTVTAAQSAVSITVGQPEFGFNVIPGSTRRIFATVTQGSTNQVLWTVKSGLATLSSTSGSWVDVTAPATGSACSIPVSGGNYSVTSSTQFTVEATSVDDGTQMTDVTFNVCNPAVQVSVVPFYRTLYAKQPADIQSLIVGSVDQNVHWAITSKPVGGDGTLGDTTSRDTVFAATVPGRYQLTATSQADTSKTATAVLYVTGNTIPYAGPVTPSLTEPVDCSVDPSMSGTVYDVGPSQAFKTLASVPFPTMTAGSTVRLHNEDTSGINPTQYHEYVQISRAGTETQPIRICGVPDSAGNPPIVDGANATGRSDTSATIGGLGLMTLHTDNSSAVWPNFNGAAYIAVEGIHFRNAKTGYSYIAPNGSAADWKASSACVRVNQGQNIAFVGNDFDNCGDGVYAAWDSTDGWGSSDLNVLWEGNHLHNNGVANSTNSHQMYLEAWGQVVQFNRIDNYVAGGLGANLKSRGLQDVIRYNYFGDGPQRQMDLVDVTDAPTYMSFSGFLHGGAGSYHGANPADAYTADQLAAEQEAWNSHYAYSNIYQNSVSAAPIHFAMDTNGGEQARKGSLYWYNNTFNEGTCTGCTTLTLFDTSAGGGTYIPQTEFQTVQSFNNIIWLANPTQQTFQWNNYDAFIGVSGANLLTANWGTNNPTGGAGSGWNSTANATAYQNAGNLSLHLTGFQNITTATSIPFNPVSWALTGDLQGNQGIPNAVCEMPPRFSYMPSLGYAIPRITGPNLGATDTVAEAAAEMTTLVGPQQFNTHYSNCR